MGLAPWNFISYWGTPKTSLFTTLIKKGHQLRSDNASLSSASRSSFIINMQSCSYLFINMWDLRLWFVSDWYGEACRISSLTPYGSAYVIWQRWNPVQILVIQHSSLLLLILCLFLMCWGLNILLHIAPMSVESLETWWIFWASCIHYFYNI